MPTDKEMAGSDAFEIVCDNLNSPKFSTLVGANEPELIFLSDLLNSSAVYGIVQAHECLMDEELVEMEPVSCDNVLLLEELTEDLSVLALKNKHAKELYSIIKNPYFISLITTHDDVASKNYEALPAMFPVATNLLPSGVMATSAPSEAQVFPIYTTDAIRMVGIRKKPDENLGITVKTEEHGLVVARILAGNMIDKQGLLHVGDVIKEINGTEVNTPEELEEMITRSHGNITMKIIPTDNVTSNNTQIFLKAHFDYNPNKDNLIPSREAGLSFKDGDILQVVNKNDDSWWQARRIDDESKSGLIPSKQLEEKRKAFVRPQFDYTHNSLLCGIMTKKKKKMMYQSKKNTEFDRTDLAIYEEMARMPPFHRKALVLVGAQGVGRRTLKERIINTDPQRFGSILPHTDSPLESDESNGEYFWHVTKEEMMQEIADNQFVEYGEYDQHYYGIKFDTIRECINNGKMCILDLSPQAIKTIKTAEFMPYVIFIEAAPIEIQRNMHQLALSMKRIDKYKDEREFRATFEESEKIKNQYKHYFDLIIMNDNFDLTYDRLRRAIETLSTQPQWVPINWVY